MTEKELQAARNKSQVVKNILKSDFDFKWDGIDYTLEKGESEAYPFYLAEHCAFHMARKYCVDANKNFQKEGGAVVDTIMGKTTIEYDKLTKKQASELAEERKISLENNKGGTKTLTELRKDLKASH